MRVARSHLLEERKHHVQGSILTAGAHRRGSTSSLTPTEDPHTLCKIWVRPLLWWVKANSSYSGHLDWQVCLDGTGCFDNSHWRRQCSSHPFQDTDVIRPPQSRLPFHTVERRPKPFGKSKLLRRALSSKCFSTLFRMPSRSAVFNKVSTVNSPESLSKTVTPRSADDSAMTLSMLPQPIMAS